MKSMIFLAIVIATLIVQVHGDCDLESISNSLTKCKAESITGACKCLSTAAKCLVGKSDMYDSLRESIKSAKDALECGASSLTNVGLPMMILVALAAFFNK